MTGWRHSPDVAWLGDRERAVLLPLDRLEELPLVLIGSSAAIWHAVDGARDADAVVETVANAFDLSPEAVEDDVRAFLDDLAARGLIAPGEGTGG